LRDVVLDSFAVLVYLYGQKGHERVVKVLEDAAEAGKACLIAAPNWAEVRSMVERKSGTARWSEVRRKLLGLPIEVRPADIDLAEMAGSLKAVHRMSLADCFAAALAKASRAELYTGDPEFRAVEDDLKLVWL
jgi:predicted nucleic acid-binding protein